LNKCQYAWHGWCDINWQYRRQWRPTQPTVNGLEFDVDAPAYNDPPVMIYESETKCRPETLLEKALRLKILDKWIPYTIFQVSANHRLTYTGDKAISLWKAWCEKQFNKKKKK
jgi:hypothetical protein